MRAHGLRSRRRRQRPYLQLWAARPHGAQSCSCCSDAATQSSPRTAATDTAQSSARTAATGLSPPATQACPRLGAPTHTPPRSAGAPPSPSAAPGRDTAIVHLVPFTPAGHFTFCHVLFVRVCVCVCVYVCVLLCVLLGRLLHSVTLALIRILHPYECQGNRMAQAPDTLVIRKTGIIPTSATL